MLNFDRDCGTQADIYDFAPALLDAILTRIEGAGSSAVPDGRLIKCTSCMLRLALSCEFANKVFVFQVHASYCYVPLPPTFGYDRTQQRLSAHCAPSLKILLIRSLIDLSSRTYFDAICILSRLLQTMLKCVLFRPVVLGRPTALPTFE